MHRCKYNKTLSSQDKIPAGNLNWSQCEDNDSDCINNYKTKTITSYQEAQFKKGKKILILNAKLQTIPNLFNFAC